MLTGFIETASQLVGELVPGSCVPTPQEEIGISIAAFPVPSSNVLELMSVQMQEEEND